jgi:parvulin-like peptidyl-prolyl isomerase
MLDSMRRHANSWVFSLLFAVIIFVFAVNFGPWAGRVAPAHIYAAEVNGRVIGIAEFNRAFEDAMHMQQQFNPNYTRELAFKTELPKQIVDNLIQRELLAQLAEENGIVISDEELARTITGGQAVNTDAYREAILSKYGMTIAQFEAKERREMLAFRMRDVVISGLPISESDLKTSFFIQNDQVSVDYIRIDPAHFIVKDPPLKEGKMDAARLFADEIIKELAAGKKLDQVTHKDLIKKDKGVSPNAKDIAPVFASTDLFARNDPYVKGFGYMTPEVTQAAFDLSETSKYSSKPILSNDKLYIFALKERKHPDASEFTKNKDALKEKLLRDRGPEFFNGFLDQLKKNAKIVYNDALLQGGEAPVEG